MNNVTKFQKVGLPSTLKVTKSTVPEPGIIRTHSGIMFDLLHPSVNSIEIRDIAWSLSKMIRYNGHIPYDYTVARHSVILSYYVPDEYALEALLHDAGEAYVGDMVSPLKVVCPQFEEIEDKITAKIMFKYNYGKNVYTKDFDQYYKKSDVVDLADYEIYQHECSFMSRPGRRIQKMYLATKQAMEEVGLGNVKTTGKDGDFEAFLTRFNQLSGDFSE